jgi:hypothetical protein
MDLSLFHQPAPDGSPRNFRVKDKLNGWTKLHACRILEWSGWYNYGLPQRLLGHYRLFQHFKKNYDDQHWEFPATKAYILDYRVHHGIKSSLSSLTSFLYSIFTLKDHYPVAQVAAINRTLVNDSSGILQEFLLGTDEDFATALAKALQQINEPAFLDRTLTKPVIIENIVKEGPNGKPKGVLSKKQLLILFDMLSELGRLEKIDLSKTSRYDGIAELFHAITGKSTDSIKKELNDYRHIDLYHCHDDRELNQLVITMTNLSNTFKAAGFNTVSDLLERKIISLRQKKKS